MLRSLSPRLNRRKFRFKYYCKVDDGIAFSNMLYYKLLHVLSISFFPRGQITNNDNNLHKHTLLSTVSLLLHTRSANNTIIHMLNEFNPYRDASPTSFVSDQTEGECFAQLAQEQAVRRRNEDIVCTLIFFEREASPKMKTAC